MIKFSLVLVIISFFTVYPQESKKWGKAAVDYTIPLQSSDRDYGFNRKDAGAFITKGFIDLYWIFISDEDGDTCPFNPSCSSFFLEAADKTGIIEGTLMFADRFTRDINIFNRQEKYPVIIAGKYYDPPEKYILSNSVTSEQKGNTGAFIK